MIGYDIDAVDPAGDDQLNIGDTIFGDLSTGNVGIGTISPTEKLVVSSGAIKLASATNLTPR